jgi:hypothetical protein
MYDFRSPFLTGWLFSREDDGSMSKPEAKFLHCFTAKPSYKILKKHRCSLTDVAPIQAFGMKDLIFSPTIWTHLCRLWRLFHFRDAD